MKKFKTLFIFVLITVFLSQASACFFKDGYIKPRINGPHMSERVYKRVDVDGALSCINEVLALLPQEDKLDEIGEKREKFFTDYYNNLNTMYVLSSINYDLDNESEYWQEESLASANIYTQLQNEAIKMEQAILSSELYGKTFIDALGQEYASMILANQTDSDEQLAILQEINQIQSQYILNIQQGNTASMASDYIKLVNLNNEYASSKTNAEGVYYKNYLEYAYETQFMREYTPDEAYAFEIAVKDKARATQAEVDKYYSLVSPLTTTSITEADIKTILPLVIKKTAPDMMDAWEYMMKRELYDFSISSKKSQTSYVTTFDAYGDAYMFIDASGSFLQDVSTIIHEFGHYNENFMACPLWADPSLPGANYDLLEVHSQAFELITLPAVGEVINSKYPVENLYKSYTYHAIDNVLWVLLSGTCFSYFEYMIYNATTEELTESFVTETFNDACEDFLGSAYFDFYQVNHFFTAPAYYISYPVSMIISAEVWASEKPIDNYINIVKLGGQNTIATICEKTNIPSPLSTEAIDMVCNKITTFTQSVFN